VTALDAPTNPTETAAPPAAPPAPAPAKGANGVGRRVMSIAVVALAVILVALALFAVFEGPVANAWYANRQRQLAAQLAAPGEHHGAGKAIAVLQVPRLDLNVVVAEGDSPQQLRNGPGHRIGTPQPGDIGNAVISGHRSGWGGPLNGIGAIKTGDFVVVQVQGAEGLPRAGVFKVTAINRVRGDDPTPFANSTDRRVTLLTGTGGSYSDDRIAITAVSGPVGKTLPLDPRVRATTSGGSAIFNAWMGLAVLAFGVALLLALVLRKRYHRVAIAVVVAPLLVLGLLGLMLNIDASLPLLR
jgi:sortase A